MRPLLASPADQAKIDRDPLVVVVTPHRTSTRAGATARRRVRCVPVKRQRLGRHIDLVSVASVILVAFILVCVQVPITGRERRRHGCLALIGGLGALVGILLSEDTCPADPASIIDTLLSIGSRLLPLWVATLVIAILSIIW